MGDGITLDVVAGCGADVGRRRRCSPPVTGCFAAVGCQAVRPQIKLGGAGKARRRLRYADIRRRWWVERENVAIGCRKSRE